MTRQQLGKNSESKSHHRTGEALTVGFDFSAQISSICCDMTSRLPDLRHIDMSRVVVAVSQARKNVRHGLWASLTPMRFEGGKLETTRRGRRLTFQRLIRQDGHEYLYILRFYLPRFMDLSFHEKVSTIIHELWHISPSFDGDMRRHPGRFYAHSASQKRYDQAMDDMADRWLRLAPPEDYCDFLRSDFSQLARRHGRIRGLKVNHPKLIPL